MHDANEETTIDALDALDSAVAEFESRLSIVAADQWAAPSPCEKWNVRFLVAHVVGGNRFAASVLDGVSSAAAIETVMSTPQLGNDPTYDFTSTAEKQRRQFRANALMNSNVDHPIGSISTTRFLKMRTLDIALHAWDLAVAINADPLLDARLVGALLHIISSESEGMGFAIGSLGRTSGDASPQDLLLDLSGRGTH